MEKYQKELVEKLAAAQKRVRQGRAVKALKDNAPDLFEIIDIEITLGLNKLTQPEPLSDREHLATHGYIKGLQKARDIMNAVEKQEVSAAAEARAVDEQLQSITKNR